MKFCPATGTVAGRIRVAAGCVRTAACEDVGHGLGVGLGGGGVGLGVGVGGGGGVGVGLGSGDGLLDGAGAVDGVGCGVDDGEDVGVEVGMEDGDDDGDDVGVTRATGDVTVRVVCTWQALLQQSLTR